MAFDPNKVIKDNISCFINKQVVKASIVIHHTASNGNPHNVIAGWRKKADGVCTPYVVAGNEDGTKTFKDGDIVQAFDDKYSCYHLGLKNTDFTPFGLPYKDLNSSAIAIELCSWGYLTKTSTGAFINYVGSSIPAAQVCTLAQPFRGYSYYQKYTEKQLASLKDLLIYLCGKYNIPKAYNGNMFETNKDALRGKGGIWTHVSFRKSGKWDCFNQPELITMLKSL